MKSKKLAPAVLAAIVLAVVATSCATSETGTANPGGTTPATVDQTLGEDKIWNDGPCDPAKPKLPLGIMGTFESPVISLKDQAVAAEVAAEAFNRRGGVNGSCLSMAVCDDKANPNEAQNCARRFVDDGVVLTTNDSVTAGIDGVLAITSAAGLPRLDGNPAPQAMGSPLTYALGAGGFGSTATMVPALTTQGIKKIAIIRVDSPGAAALGSFLGPMITAHGGEFVSDTPVPAGTTDYTQFILSAQAAGAEGAILALGEQEATLVLQAAEQLGSELKFSAGLGTFSQASVRSFGPFAEQMIFNAEVPPPSSDPTDRPLLAVAVRELAASGEEKLQVDKLQTSSLKSWVSVYGAVKILRDAKVTTFTRESVITAFNGAEDVDMGGIIRPWTPNAEAEGRFKRISNPWYYVATWDEGAGNFVLTGEQLNVVDQLAGKVS